MRCSRVVSKQRGHLRPVLGLLRLLGGRVRGPAGGLLCPVRRRLPRSPRGAGRAPGRVRCCLHTEA